MRVLLAGANPAQQLSLRLATAERLKDAATWIEALGDKAALGGSATMRPEREVISEQTTKTNAEVYAIRLRGRPTASREGSYTRTGSLPPRQRRSDSRMNLKGGKAWLPVLI